MASATANIAKKLSGLTLNPASNITGGITKAFSLSNTTLLYVFGFLIIIAAIATIMIVWAKNLQFATVENVTRILGTQRSVVEAGLSPYYKTKRTLFQEPVGANEKCLINYAPLTVFQPGFLGPLTNGVYNERDGVMNTLKAGARCFVLPIDYHEDASLDPKLYAGVGAPCLLMRDQGGNIRSLNSGSIQKITQAIADAAFSDTIFSKNDPVILVLYFVRTPPVNTKEYLRFCSQVAKELSPLTQYHLGQTPEGVYNRQGRQNELLYSPLNLLEKKALIFANIDLTSFRNTKALGLSPFQPREDLDFWVHLRLYKEIDEELGASVLADKNEFPRGYIHKSDYFNAIPDNRKNDAIAITKIRWTLVLPNYGVNPTNETLKKMLDTYGVQAPALYMYDFNEKNTDAKLNLNMWKDTAWRAKPAPIRFVIPTPFVPGQPSPQMNAMGGNLRSPSI
jgi:hypothetical protein